MRLRDRMLRGQPPSSAAVMRGASHVHWKGCLHGACAGEDEIGVGSAEEGMGSRQEVVTVNEGGKGPINCIHRALHPGPTLSTVSSHHPI